MSKFKVGDKVEIIGGNYFGLDKEKELTIEEVCDDGTVLISDDITEAYKEFKNVKLIKRGEDNMDKEFKVGDRVEITSNTTHSFSIGQIVTIDKLPKHEGNSYLLKDVNGLPQYVEREQFKKAIDINDKVVVIDSDCIGYSLNEILTVSKVLYDDVLEVTDEYGDVGLIKTEYVEPHVEKEQFKVGDFVKVIISDRGYLSVGTIGLVSYVYNCGENVNVAIVDSDGDFHSDLFFNNDEVQKIEIGEL